MTGSVEFPIFELDDGNSPLSHPIKSVIHPQALIGGKFANQCLLTKNHKLEACATKYLRFIRANPWLIKSIAIVCRCER